jgi:hypothetical protein
LALAERDEVRRGGAKVLAPVERGAERRARRGLYEGIPGQLRIEESEGGSAAVVAADAAARPDNDVEPVADWLAASVSA